MKIKGKNKFHKFILNLEYSIIYSIKQFFFCNNIKMESIPQKQFVKSENHSSFKDQLLYWSEVSLQKKKIVFNSYTSRDIWTFQYWDTYFTNSLNIILFLRMRDLAAVLEDYEVEPLTSRE